MAESRGAPASLLKKARAALEKQQSTQSEAADATGTGRDQTAAVTLDMTAEDTPAEQATPVEQAAPKQKPEATGWGLLRAATAADCATTACARKIAKKEEKEKEEKEEAKKAEKAKEAGAADAEAGAEAAEDKNDDDAPERGRSSSGA